MPISLNLEVTLARAREKLFRKNFEEMPPHKGATWNKEKHLLFLSFKIMSCKLMLSYP